MEVKLNDLPVLPFEKILSYLSLEDRIRSRGVSRKWYRMINNFKPTSLCYSDRPSERILGKRRWVSGAFAQNFICCTRFESFFDTFSQSMLSNLKCLRLCRLELNVGRRGLFVRTLNSFDRLRKLDLIGFKLQNSYKKIDVKLTLPMLQSLHLEDFRGIRKLTLDSPRLQNVKIWKCSYFLILDFVHLECVEKLQTSFMCFVTKVKKMKNLKILYMGGHQNLDPTFLSGLKQLKEVHIEDQNKIRLFFNQKQQYGLVNLKVFYFGCLLNGPNDPATRSLFYPSEETFAFWTTNPSRLAEEIPFLEPLTYTEIEHVAPGLEVNVLNKITDLNTVIVAEPVQDIQRFLGVLKNFDIFDLAIHSDQPQDLFDRLPDHSAVQNLTIRKPPPNLSFLCRLEGLLHLNIDDSDGRVQQFLKEQEFLSNFDYDLNKD